MISKTGRVVVKVERRMDKFARRADGSQTKILADTRFDNHNKMTIVGTVLVGTSAPDVNPVEDADRIMPRCTHYPQGYIGGGVFPVDIRAGDRVYFHYLCVEDLSSMERRHDGSWEVYMQVSDIFCMEREGKMIMNQNWCLGAEVREDMTKEYDTGSGIEVVHGFNIKTYVDEAKISKIQPTPYRGVYTEVKVGDRVYLSKDAGFPNIIGSYSVLVFRQTDILARWAANTSNVTPVGENHLVKMPVDEYKVEYDFKERRKVIVAPKWGEIVASGKACRWGYPGYKIIFTRRWCRPLDKEYYLVADSEIQAVAQ